jgi:hypothetical protein
MPAAPGVRKVTFKLKQLMCRIGGGERLRSLSRSRARRGLTIVAENMGFPGGSASHFLLKRFDQESFCSMDAFNASSRKIPNGTISANSA